MPMTDQQQKKKPKMSPINSLSSSLPTLSRIFSPLHCHLSYSLAIKTLIFLLRTPSRSRVHDPAGDSPPPPANRTSSGRVLVFHRVPKTGSEMMQEMGKALARLKGFRAFVDPWPPVYFPTHEQSEAFADNFRKEVLKEVEGEGGRGESYII